MSKGRNCGENKRIFSGYYIPACPSGRVAVIWRCSSVRLKIIISTSYLANENGDRNASCPHAYKYVHVYVQQIQTAYPHAHASTFQTVVMHFHRHYNHRRCPKWAEYSPTRHTSRRGRRKPREKESALQRREMHLFGKTTTTTTTMQSSRSYRGDALRTHLIPDCAYFSLSLSLHLIFAGQQKRHSYWQFFHFSSNFHIYKISTFEKRIVPVLLEIFYELSASK